MGYVRSIMTWSTVYLDLKTCSCAVINDIILYIASDLSPGHSQLIFQCYAPVNGTPHSPTTGLGNSGDLTEYHVENSSPGALPDVNTPIYRQENIGDLT